MLKSLWIGASGMTAQAEKIDLIANNLANVQTTGYKKQQASFSDLFYQSLRTNNQPVKNTPDDKPVMSGTGVKLAHISNLFTQGPLLPTDRELDVAIEGQGFLEVILPNGQFAYTREGILQVAADGTLINSLGYPLSDLITIPPGAHKVKITPEGDITVIEIDGTTLELGNLTLYAIENPSKLEPIGQNLFVITEENELPEGLKPGTAGMGSIRQGFLEGSNVEYLMEVTQLLTAQRAYQFNSRIIQAADEMWSMANQLRR